PGRVVGHPERTAGRRERDAPGILQIVVGERGATSVGDERGDDIIVTGRVGLTGADKRRRCNRCMQNKTGQWIHSVPPCDREPSSPSRISKAESGALLWRHCGGSIIPLTIT